MRREAFSTERGRREGGEKIGRRAARHGQRMAWFESRLLTLQPLVHVPASGRRKGERREARGMVRERERGKGRAQRRV